MSAALAVGLAVALVLGGCTDPVVLVVAVGLAQVLLAVAWFPALGAAGAAGGRALVVATGLAADVAVLVADDTRPMEHVAPVLAIALLFSLVHQLFRRDGRVGLTVSLTATGSAVALAGLGSAWLALGSSRDGTALLVLAAAAASLPAVADLAGSAVGTPRWVAASVAAAGTAAAALALPPHTDLGRAPVLATAAGAAVAARLATVLADRAPAPQPALPAALPVVLVAPTVYLLARVLLG